MKINREIDPVLHDNYKISVSVPRHHTVLLARGEDNVTVYFCNEKMFKKHGLVWEKIDEFRGGIR